MEQTAKPAEAPKPKGRKMWLAITAIVIVVIAVVAGLYVAGYFGGGGTPVSILDDKVCSLNAAACKYDPATLSVKSGTTVKWTNNGGLAHTVTTKSGAPAAFDHTLNPNGDTYSFTFSTTGTYNYYCTIHAWMTASVTVT